MKNVLIALSLSCALLFSLQSQASFEENTHRYLTSYEVFDSLTLLIPYVGHGTCGKDDVLTQEAAVNVLAALGENSTITGSPISQGPSQGTIAWISKCINAALSISRVTVFTEADYQKLFADSRVLQTLEKVSGAGVAQADFYKVFERPWSEIPAEAQQQLIEYFTYYYLGSDDVLVDFGLIQDPSQFKKELMNTFQTNKTQPTYQVIQKLVINLVLRDEFLSY